MKICQYLYFYDKYGIPIFLIESPHTKRCGNCIDVTLYSVIATLRAKSPQSPLKVLSCFDLKKKKSHTCHWKKTFRHSIMQINRKDFVLEIVFRLHHI